eukprot:3568762-Pleurochrysis_carterae.AAC.4
MRVHVRVYACGGEAACGQCNSVCERGSERVRVCARVNVRIVSVRVRRTMSPFSIAFFTLSSCRSTGARTQSFQKGSEKSARRYLDEHKKA